MRAFIALYDISICIFTFVIFGESDTVRDTDAVGPFSEEEAFSDDIDPIKEGSDVKIRAIDSLGEQHYITFIVPMQHEELQDFIRERLILTAIEQKRSFIQKEKRITEIVYTHKGLDNRNVTYTTNVKLNVRVYLFVGRNTAIDTRLLESCGISQEGCLAGTGKTKVHTKHIITCKMRPLTPALC